MSQNVMITRELAPSLPEIFFEKLGVPTSDHEAFYVFTVHKCASTMQRRLFTEIGEHNGMANVDIDRFRFSTGTDSTPEQIEDFKNIFLPKGYWYGIYRRLGLAKAHDFDAFDLTKKSILTVRDPRDIMTSMFFSTRYSHNAPGGQNKKRSEVKTTDMDIDIDSYALKIAPNWVKRYNKYMEELMPLDTCKVYRYEDVIPDKYTYLMSVAGHLDLDLPKAMAKELAEKENRQPKKEDKYKHIRRVTPGDHKEKLKPETVERLNELFANILKTFDYAS